MKKRSTGKTLPIGGRDYGPLDLLMGRTRFPKGTWVGRRIVVSWILLRGTRANIERYAHLIWE